MKALFTAIYNAFSSSKGALYLQEAPNGATLPYIVYYLINAVPDYTFDSVTEDYSIQFSVYAETAETACSIFEEIKAIYDDCSLAVTGYEFVKMEREISHLIKEEDLFHYVVQYRILIHKNP